MRGSGRLDAGGTQNSALYSDLRDVDLVSVLAQRTRVLHRRICGRRLWLLLQFQMWHAKWLEGGT